MDSYLKTILNNLFQTVQLEYLDRDPLELVRQYDRPEDLEIAAFISAAFALGRYGSIRKTVSEILSFMSPSPYDFIRHFNPDRHSHLFQHFVYRFYRSEDLGLLIGYLHQIVDTWGSLENCFLEGYTDSETDITRALSHFVRTILSLKTAPFYPEPPIKGSGIRHFLADPRDGSTCKRLNLFLRWVVRKGSLDLGIWKHVSPSRLIIPVDTHITRMGRCLGLTSRKSPDWKMAVEITESLRIFDKEDPVKYDFALCTVGKLQACPKKINSKNCADCPVRSACIALIKHKKEE